MAYDAAAIEMAWGLYARGVNGEPALIAMQKVYPGFAASTWQRWITDYKWRERRAAMDEQRRAFESTLRDASRVLIGDLETTRKKLMARIEEQGADAQSVYALSTVCAQIFKIGSEHLRATAPEFSVERVASVVEEFVEELRAVPALAAVMGREGAAVAACVERFMERYTPKTTARARE